MAAPTTAEIAAGLLYPTFYWSGPVITWSIPTAGSTWPGYSSAEPTNSHYATLNAQQAGRVGDAIGLWDRLIATSFVQTNDLTATGQIRVAMTDVDALRGHDVWGYAYSPAFMGGTSITGGDVWLDFDRASSTFAAGQFDFEALLHELGHAIGLKHSFGEGAVIPTEYDTSRYTIMSYTDYTDDLYRVIEPTADGGITTVSRYVNASTPMVFDIAAMQSRYGADLTTAAGNTTYTWSQSGPIMEAIYDAGGIDTFDLSNMTRGSLVDLTPGAYSSIGYFSASAQAAYWTALYPWAASFLTTNFSGPSIYTWSQNVGIAYSTVIENIIGSAGNDTLLGNDADNTISGGAGEDYVRGGLGNDSLTGGAAFDDINGNQGNDTARGGDGNDWVVGGKDNDSLMGENGDDIVYGNLGNDTCDGGEGNDLIRGGQGDDSLSGGNGNDWMSGDRGNDTLTGGAGADTFHTFSGAGIDRVLDFSYAQGDRVQVDLGTTFTISQSGADTVVDMGNGDQLILTGVVASTLPAGWIFTL